MKDYDDIEAIANNLSEDIQLPDINKRMISDRFKANLASGIDLQPTALPITSNGKIKKSITILENGYSSINKPVKTIISRPIKSEAKAEVRTNNSANNFGVSNPRKLEI